MISHFLRSVLSELEHENSHLMDAKPSSQLSPPVMLMLSYFSEAIDTTVLFHLQRESRDQPAVCCPSVYWQQVMIYARHLFGQLLISKQSNQNAEFALLW